MKMKKVISTMLAIAMLGSLIAGCGSKKADSTTATNADGATVVTMWAHQTEDTDEGALYKKLIDKFNEDNKGKIEVELTGIARTGDAGGYDDKVNAAITNDSMPDIFTVDGPTVSANADAGTIVPIGDYFDEEDLKDFNTDIVEQGTYDGTLYTLGTSDSSVLLYYNKDMFEAAGITAPAAEDPWTWDEFYDACKKLSKDGVYGASLGLGTYDEWDTYAFLPMIQSGGGNIVSDDGNETADGYLNGKETIDALSFIKKLVDDNVVSATPEDYTFEKGSSAMVLSGPWEIATLKDYPEINWGTISYPIKEEGAKMVSPCGTWTYAISKNCPEESREAAAEVIKYLTNTENCVAMYGANAMPPARQSAYKEIPEFQEAPLDVINFQMANTAVPRPTVVDYPILSNLFAQAVGNVVTGMDVEEALNDAVDQYNSQTGK